jgi:hypothetical protein
MVLSIIFLEDKHNILLHLSIFYEYQQFFQHRGGHRGRIFYFFNSLTLQWSNFFLDCIVLKIRFWFCDLQDSPFVKKNIRRRILWLVLIFTIYILWVSTVFSTPYLFLDTAARLQWPVTQISTSQQFFYW